MYDLLIRQVKVVGYEEPVDVAIKDGLIAEIKGNIRDKASEEIKAQGMFLSPGFVDAHTHLEKALTGEGVEVSSLGEAIATFKKGYAKISKEDFIARGKKVVEMAVKNGTTAIRTHIYVDTVIGTKAIEAILEVKKQVKNLLDLQVIAMPTNDTYVFDDELLCLTQKAIELGVDVLGGAPHLAEDPKPYINTIFDLALKNNLPIDFHVDESDEPEVRTLEYIAEKTIATGMHGQVTAGHCTSLAAVSDEIAERVIGKCAKAGLHIITLPSCNLYLMGRKDKQPIRRGVTRVKDFLNAGVNIAYASDNIRDPFRPYGNADMLEEGLLTAQVLQMGTPSELETVYQMGTYNPAKILGLKDYGTKVGCKADLVLLEASSPSEAIISQATKAYVIKNGKPVAKTIKEQILL
jgi:cytosine deaminase